MKNELVATRLSQVAELNPRAVNKLEGDDIVSFLSMSAVTVEGTTSDGEERRYSEVSKGYTTFEDGDLLVAKITPCFENGKIAQAKLSNKYGFGSTEFHVIRPNFERLDARYLLHFLRQANIRLDGAQKMTGSAGHRRVSVSFFSDLQILLPSLSEQKRIAAILDEVKLLIAKRRLCLDLLGTLNRTILDDVLDGAERHRGWTVAALGDVAEVQGGLQVTGARKKYSIEVPYLRVANVYRGFLKLDEIKNILVSESERARALLLKNDILIVEGHGNPEEVGRCALWDASIKLCTHQNHLIRARFNQQQVIPRFACDYLNSLHGRRHLFRAGKTTSGLNTISVSNVRTAPLVIPPLSVQQRYLHHVEMIDAMTARQHNHLGQLETLFASLQHRAFRGEL